MILGVKKIRPFRYGTTTYIGGCSIKQDTNVPRLLLGRLFNTSTTTNWHKYVFCKIEETIESLKDNKISVLDDMVITLVHSNCLYGFNRNALDRLLEFEKMRKGLDSNQVSKMPVQFFILGAILYRLYHCYKMMNRYIEKAGNITWVTEAQSDYPGDSYKVSLWLQLFIDTHLDLCTYMIDQEAYTDDELLIIEKNNDDLSRCAFEQYYPYDGRVVFCGDLPDLTPCICLGSIWYDSKPKARVQTIISALIHIIGCKTQGHKCQLRNFIKILGVYFKKYPSMIELFRMILETSMMGNYPHTHHRPRFEQRIWIRKSFKDRYYLSNENFFKWISQNDQFVYYATKEFYMFTVEREWVLDKFMCETNNWDDMKKSIKEAMDVARTRINSDTYPHVNNFKFIHKDLKEIHQKTLPFITKLKKTGFLNKCLQEMNHYHELKIINKWSTAIQTSEMLLSEYFKKENELDVEAYIEFLTNMKFIVDRMIKGHTIETKWLKCFRISEEGYNLIRELYFEYECEDIADNALSRRIDKIYKNKPYDFHLIRVFFRMIQENHALEVYPLSCDYAENQLAALRSKYCILPWETLPDSIDEFYYCSVCQKWLHPIVDPTVAKTRPNVYAQGFEKTLYDHASGKLYCGKQNTSINVRKLMDSGVYYIEGEIEDLAAARIIRRYKETARCCDTPLRSVHMLGVVQKLNGKLWALCEICGVLTQWEGAKFDNLGFTCGRHNRTEAAEKKTTDKILGAVPNTLVVPETITVFDNKWGGDETTGFSTDSRKIKKRKVERLENLQCCLYCKMKKEDDKGAGRFVRILNDDNGIFTYADAWLCTIDSDRCRRLLVNNMIVRKSKIIQTVGRRFSYEGMKTHIKKPINVIR